MYVSEHVSFLETKKTWRTTKHEFPSVRSMAGDPRKKEIAGIISEWLIDACRRSYACALLQPLQPSLFLLSDFFFYLNLVSSYTRMYAGAFRVSAPTDVRQCDTGFLYHNLHIPTQTSHYPRFSFPNCRVLLFLKGYQFGFLKQTFWHK